MQNIFFIAASVAFFIKAFNFLNQVLKIIKLLNYWIAEHYITSPVVIVNCAECSDNPADSRENWNQIPSVHQNQFADEDSQNNCREKKHKSFKIQIITYL